MNDMNWDKFEKKHNSLIRITVLAWVAWLVFCIAAISALVWVAWHFIGKYW